jgi:hypothetical protein
MTDQHPITPPPELIQKWGRVASALDDPSHGYVLAARWGADQELEACVQWAEGYDDWGDCLLADRRPNSPSLKERALARLALLERLVADLESVGLVPFHEKDDSIRQALEQLND